MGGQTGGRPPNLGDSPHPGTWGPADLIAACEDPQMGESLVSAGLGSTLDLLTVC